MKKSEEKLLDAFLLAFGTLDIRQDFEGGLEWRVMQAQTFHSSTCRQVNAESWQLERGLLSLSAQKHNRKGICFLSMVLACPWRRRSYSAQRAEVRTTNPDCAAGAARTGIGIGAVAVAGEAPLKGGGAQCCSRAAMENGQTGHH